MRARGKDNGGCAKFHRAILGTAPREGKLDQSLLPPQSGTMIHDSKLETERLEVRPFSHDDVPRLVEIFADPDVARFVDDGEPMPAEVGHQWVENSLANLAKHGCGTGAVIEKSTGRLIGWAGIARPPDDLPELIYGFEKPAWRKGYGRELLAALVDYSHEAGVVPVRATVNVENKGSIALLETAGFRLVEKGHKGEATSCLYALD